jgi:Omp85 superfamily domain
MSPSGSARAPRASRPVSLRGPRAAAPAARGRRLVRAVAAAFALLWWGRAAAECRPGLKTEIIPLPVYATLPNEGNTWGVMPVFLRVCPEGERTESIIAPSLTWNSVIRYTSTVRWFYYPSDDTSMTLIGSASTRTNFNLLFVWQHVPTTPAVWTDEATVRVQRSVFFRFFGLGPDTLPGAESSYTGLRTYAIARLGRNLAPYLNLGASLGVERDGVEANGVPGLPLSGTAFPDAPGVHGATLATQGIDLRYDDRSGGDYAERGFRLDLSASVVEGLDGSPTYLRGGMQVRGIVPELSWLSGAARLYWNGVTSGRAPFYQQSSLGGSLLMRGFTEDRFIDRQAWTIELEQRVRLFQTHIFGVVADWRADPFLAVGQVFGAFSEAASHPKVTAGIGFRAFVHPNVLGRVDVANGGEGFKVYVELGYPY